MRRFVVLRLLLTLSAFATGSAGVALMGADASDAQRIVAALLIAAALVTVPLAYQVRPSALAAAASSLVTLALGLVALTPFAAAYLGGGAALALGIVALASAAGQLACLREPATAARVTA